MPLHRPVASIVPGALRCGDDADSTSLIKETRATSKDLLDDVFVRPRQRAGSKECNVGQNGTSSPSAFEPNDAVKLLDREVEVKSDPIEASLTGATYPEAGVLFCLLIASQSDLQHQYNTGRSYPTDHPKTHHFPQTSRPSRSITNNIHPLLARDKFPSYIKYNEAFLQPARLVTRMLSTPQAQHYLFTLLVQSKHLSEVSDEAKLQSHRIHAPKGINDLTDADRQRVDTFLTKLAGLVTYSVRECQSDQDIGCCYKMGPRTVEEASTSTSTSISGERTMTARSVIRISRSRLYDPLLQDQTPKDKLVRQFKMAVTGRVKEDFFQDEIFAEVGYQFEVCLTGLVPLSEPHPESIDVTPLVVWRPWPCLSYLGSYDLDGLCSDQSKLEYHRGWDKVDSYYIKNLFSDSFWEVKVKSDGFKAVLARPIRHFKVASSMKSVQSLLAEKGVKMQQLIPLSMAPKEGVLTSDQAERMLGLLGEISGGVAVQAKQTGSVEK